MAYRFDVSFSFAGPHREKVRAIAELVAAKLDPGLLDHSAGRVFYDSWFEAELGGDDGDSLLQHFYEKESLMVVTDLSEDYAGRRYPQAEARAIRALRGTIDTARDHVSRLRLAYIRFDAGEVPGVTSLAIDWNANEKTNEEIAGLILSRLAKLKQGLAERAATSAPPRSAPVPPLLASPAPTRAAPPILFFHPATNDALYSRRERELDWLDDCARNPAIRIATVTGVGGLGKTSLVGHWIEVRHGWQHRAFRGVFFYSFYSDRESEHFFRAFLDFVRDIERITNFPKDKPPHHLGAYAVQKWRYLVVLDGLEVLQQGEEERRYGWIADGELNEFVARAGAAGESLLVLTSRFPFPEITHEHLHHASGKELPLLEAREGADLLARCGLAEPLNDLQVYSAQFGGHPLALRLFAGACMTSPFTEPADAARCLLQDNSADALPNPEEPGIGGEERQRRKQRRQFYKLLTWFQMKLPADKRRLLQIVALFKEPVTTRTIVSLAQGLEAMRKDFEGCDDAHIYVLLAALEAEHLLQREDRHESDTARWTAHPIVRDVFRTAALKAGGKVAAQFAEIVAGRSKGGEMRSVAEVRPIIEAVEVLLAAGDLRAAHVLYRGRLASGQVFKSIPAPQEGLRCARGFVETKERRDALEGALGRRWLASYLSYVALYARLLGEGEEAERGHRDVNEINMVAGDWGNVSLQLRNIADGQTLRGALREAVESAGEALFYAGFEDVRTPSTPSQRFYKRPTIVPPLDSQQVVRSLAYRGHALSLAGDLRAAILDFVDADRSEWLGGNRGLYSQRGIQWCSHRLRLNDSAATRRLIEANRIICQRHGWNDELAHYDLLLGKLDLEAGDLDPAARRIGQAVRVFREARIVRDLSDALLAQARLRRSVEDCEEALRLAARSGFALKQCDALNLRARLRREAGQPADAAKDARDALAIAERCGYYWGRHEALRQLREAAKALGKPADEKHWDEAEKALAARMQPEIEEALRINCEHDAEMRLYGGPKPQKGPTRQGRIRL